MKMNIEEIKQTHTLITGNAIEGIKCYAVNANGIYSIWDGEQWIGYFMSDSDGNLSEYDFWKEVNVDDLSENEQ
jgi:hypothetical protein